MTERGLRVERWRRYGKDRLYVSDQTGQRIGWVDRQSGAATVEVLAQRAEFEAAVAAFEAQSQAGARAPDVAHEITTAETARVVHPSLHEPPRAPAWRDISLQRPGQLAREQAEAQLAAMKDRSKVGTFIARAIDMKTDERAWRVGAGGEETVGTKLEKLRKHGWHVLHSVPVGKKGSDIDHVVIGWGGVYTLNTKTHPGKRIWVSPRQVRVDGHTVPTSETLASRWTALRSCLRPPSGSLYWSRLRSSSSRGP